MAQIIGINLRERLELGLDAALTAVSVLSGVILVLEFGFHLTPAIQARLFSITKLIIGFFITQEAIRLFISPRTLLHVRSRWFEIMLATFAAAYFVLLPTMDETLEAVFIDLIPLEQFTLLYLGITQGLLSFFHLLRFARSNELTARIAINPAKVFVLSFVFGVAFGTAALMLPKATYSPIGLVDALFIAASAICVTGLSPVIIVDTFTPFGQSIILFLIQIGGLGIMTITMTFVMFFSGSLGVRERIMMADMVSEERLSEVGSLLFKITATTLVIELVGAILLYGTLGHSYTDFNVPAFLQCVFHSVSAFCNAGFSIFDGQSYLKILGGNYGFSSVLMVLIVLGGLGFPTLSNLGRIVRRNRRFPRGTPQLTLASRIVLVTAAVLIFGGALVIFLLESTASFRSLGLGDRLFHSLFLSVTSRTAGFNTTPMETLGAASIIVVMMLMWIGGAPASCAGGIKTLNFAIAMLSLRAVIVGLNSPHVAARRVGYVSVRKAFAVIILSLMTIAVGICLIAFLEPDLPPLDLAFEVVSAVSTVGLTRALTSELGPESKILLTVLMLVGRVGMINVLLSITPPKPTPRYKLLKEDIFQGS